MAIRPDPEMPATVFAPVLGSRPRILVLRHRAATPHAYGGPVYTESLLRLMQQMPLAANVEQLVFEQQSGRLADRVLGAVATLRSLFSSLPAKAQRFSSYGFRHRLLRRLTTSRYDLVVINGLDMLWCLPLISDRAPVVYVCHNLEAELYAQQLRRWARWPIPSGLLRRDAAKLATLERAGVRVCAGTIAVAQGVADGITALAPQSPVLTLPPTFADTSWQITATADRRVADGPIRLGFVGNLGWWPNRVSLDWFLSEVWPRVADGYVLHLFGRGTEHLSAGRGLMRHGYVADLAEVWQTAEIMIQPIVVGSGVNIKVAEAVYHRRPMIATALALAGCGLASDPAIQIADGSKAWVRLLNGAEPRHLVGRRISETNAARFAQGGQAQRLAAFLGPLMTAGASALDTPIAPHRSRRNQFEPTSRQAR